MTPKIKLSDRIERAEAKLLEAIRQLPATEVRFKTERQIVNAVSMAYTKALAIEGEGGVEG